MKHLYSILAYSILLYLILCAAGCTPSPEDVSDTGTLPPVYPDYVGVTVPENIAPLNFLLRDSCEALYVTASAGDLEIKSHRKGNEAVFDLGDWKRLMEKGSGKNVSVTVTALSDGRWLRYLPFDIYVSGDSIDQYLTYRLIEPDYEVFSRLQIMERNVEDFSERVLCDYNNVGNRCMNCHTHAPGRGDLSFLYVRGEGGGMVLNDGGELCRLDVKTPDMVSGPVYAQFDPSGRYIVFSANSIIPAFHSRPDKRLEVFDTKSDVYVFDRKESRVVRSPLVADSTRLETFPAFSADGGSVYYCVADGPALPSRLDSMYYSLCRIGFDPVKGEFGNKVDTVVSGVRGCSVSHPRVSPDGKRLLYTVSDFGTFPIWHREADLRMLDLESGRIDSLGVVNSPMSDTYHSWSSSGRWFVFASKRDDGLYGKPYFAHVSPDGKVSKPFVLPQESPSFYDHNLKSYNVPDLGNVSVSFRPADVAATLKGK
ncbi:MAG: hypothetical protein K2H22_04830 [Muribaculaceae bacterium]|nr:hypothetical protein [Muribaculaceae bacterium]